jgi:hypothetical protein
MIKNLYLLVVNEKSLLKMLDARISLFDMDVPISQDYRIYHQLLQEDPFSLGFEERVFDTYTSMLAITNDNTLKISSQIKRIYTLLQDLIEGQ